MNDQLTIRVGKQDEPVNVYPLLSAISNTVKLLTEIDCELSQDHRPSMSWIVSKVSMHSPIAFTIKSELRRGREEVSPVGPMMDGLREMERSATKPKYFSDSALSAARALVKSCAIVLESNGSSLKPTLHIAANIDAILDQPSKYSADTALDGRLEAIYVHGGNPQFLVFDPLTDRGTRCYFPEERLEDVVDLLRSRVRVFGLAKFNKKDEATSIQVDFFERLPEQDELPSLADLHAAGINITGGEDAADYVRHLRDGEEN